MRDRRQVGARSGGGEGARLPPLATLASLPLLREIAAIVRKFAPHLALFALLLALVLGFGFERSGWILMTQPVERSHATNSLLGYSFLRDGGVLHKENLSTLRQVAYFSGTDAKPDLYYRRPVYPFLAAQLAPLTGVVAALLTVNIAAWAAAVWLCWRFTLNLYGDARAAGWAALFAAAGSGFAFHVLDLSAHLLSFTLYMAGVVAIHESRAWRERVPLRTHLALGAFLMLACLQYNTGIALVAAYCALALRHNGWRIVAATALAALLAQPAWGFILGELHALRYAAPLEDLARTEFAYLERGLQGWAWILDRPAAEMIATVSSLVGSFLLFEMPLLTLVGAGKLALDARAGAEGRERLRFVLPFVAFPVLAAMVFAPGPLLSQTPIFHPAGARGYLVYGIAIVFFAASGAAIASLASRWPRGYLPAAIALCVAAVAWNTAHLANGLGPLKSYFLGVDHAAHLFRVPSFEAVSLTGGEPVPRLFGGDANLVEAGVARLPPSSTSADPRVPYSLAASALFALLVAALVGLSTPLGARGAGVAAALLLIGPLLGTRAVIDDSAANFDQVRRIEPGAVLTYRLELSEAVGRRVAEGLARGEVPALYHHGTVLPALRVDGMSLAATRQLNRSTWMLDAASLRSVLERHPAAVLELEFRGAPDAWVGGWQRPGLAGRTVRVTGAGGELAALPGIELRLLRDASSQAPVLMAY